MFGWPVNSDHGPAPFAPTVKTETAMTLGPPASSDPGATQIGMLAPFPLIGKVVMMAGDRPEALAAFGLAYAPVLR